MHNTCRLLDVILAKYYFLLCITYNISGFKVIKTQWGPTIRFSSLISWKHCINKECVTSVHHVTQLIFLPSAVTSAREVMYGSIKTMTYWDDAIILYIHTYCKHLLIPTAGQKGDMKWRPQVLRKGSYIYTYTQKDITTQKTKLL